MNHLDQEPLDFAAAVALLGEARKELHEAIDELADKAERLRKQVRYSEARNEELRQALALLRELNDALVIPGWLQPRVDAVLDRAEEPPSALDTPFSTAGGDPAEPKPDHNRIATICELDGCCMLRDKTTPQK